METNPTEKPQTLLYAKLIDGSLVTTCVPDDDPDTLAMILADGFKPYDNSAPMPEVGVPKPAVSSDVGEGDTGKIELHPPASPLDTGVSKAVGDFHTEVDSKSAAVDPVSGSKSVSAAKPASISLSEPVPTYRDDGDRIVLEWKVVENSPAKVAAEIARLQSELAATDYQVIKSYEYALAGQPTPYNITTIHADRQSLRDRITELEAMLVES